MVAIDRRHPLLLLLVAVIAAAAGVWPPVGALAAAPAFTGTNCEDYYKVKNPSPRSGDPLSDKNPSIPDDQRKYQYENPADVWPEVELGDPFPDVEKAATIPAKIAAVRRYATAYGLRSSGNTTRGLDSGSFDHIRAARIKYLMRKLRAGEVPMGWESWRNIYVPNQGNDPKGKAYEKWVYKAFQLGPGWLCQAKIDIPDCKGLPFDMVNPELKVIHELKSGDKPDAKQLAKHKKCMEELKKQGYRMYYHFGREATDGVVESVEDPALGIEVRQTPATAELDKSQQAKDIEAARAAAAAVAAAAAASASASASASAEAPEVAPGGTTDGAARELAGAPATAKEAAEADETNRIEAEEAAIDHAAANGQTEAEAVAGAMDNAGVRPGGIDFTTLELNYLSVSGDDVKYSFSAKQAPDGVHSSGGLSKARLSSDALFTWLALPESSFWVNLNPDTPDQITDDKLAGTDVGRVLLTSDLLLKRWHVKLLNPATKIGDRLWDTTGFDTADHVPCFPIRMWISPGVASVREDGDQLYVLDAPLVANAERFTVKKQPRGSKCVGGTKTIDANVAAYQRIVVPELTKAVNNDPGFADLRRVYRSLVIAKWLRERSAVTPNAYTPMIDTGDASSWPARTKWDREKVYQDYLKSFYQGDVTYRRKVRYQGRRVPVTWVQGGVDFTTAPVETKVGAEEFAQRYAQLPATVQDSRTSPVPDPATGRLWLGGGNATDQQQTAVVPAVTGTPPATGVTTKPGDTVNASATGDLPTYRTTRFLLSALAALMFVGIIYGRLHHHRRRYRRP